jgi:hypothetical protein
VASLEGTAVEGGRLAGCRLAHMLEESQHSTARHMTVSGCTAACERLVSGAMLCVFCVAAARLLW